MMSDTDPHPEQTARRTYRVELRILVREVWEVQAEDEIGAEFHYASDPGAFIFDREEIESTVVRVDEVRAK